MAKAPAWILEALKLLAHKQKKTVDVNLVPFSGNVMSFFSKESLLPWLKNDTKSYRPAWSPWAPYNVPHDVTETTRKSAEEYNKKQRELYRGILKRHGADPATIIKQYEKTGKKTTIVDFMASGRGIASFLFILAKNTETDKQLHRLKKALAVHVPNQSEDYTYELRHPFHKKKSILFKVTGAKVKLRNDAVECLWNCLDEERIVPNCYHNSEDPFPMAEGDEKFVHRMFKELEYTVETVLEKPPLAPKAPLPRSNTSSQFVKRFSLAK